MNRSARASFEDLAVFDERKKKPPVRFLAGVDEAGRGALAGPVVAAAVICDPCSELSLVRDSKLLSEKIREELFGVIMSKSIGVSVGIIGPAVIDRINILQATLKAMRKAVEGLPVTPCHVIIDGCQIPRINCSAEAITGADNKSFSVAAASIVAKVTRDRILRENEFEFPGYGFTRNKGYGTQEHLGAIAERGRTAIHRRSFRIKTDL
ncbi:MAG: ribonuclease HII [Candidatus Krumholzibacteriota bacterium]|nr:ribonuclease HII [Candidatus Krumholzibacteriota bacterium]